MTAKGKFEKIIEHNLNFYTLTQDLYESDELFQFRTNYIIKNLNKDKFDNLVKKSRLLANIEFWGCVYNSSITLNTQ
jgi:hypothetical protein